MGILYFDNIHGAAEFGAVIKEPMINVVPPVGKPCFYEDTILLSVLRRTADPVIGLYRIFVLPISKGSWLLSVIKTLKNGPVGCIAIFIHTPNVCSSCTHRRIAAIC
jgi:hypothetical protein